MQLIPKNKSTINNLSQANNPSFTSPQPLTPNP